MVSIDQECSRPVVARQGEEERNKRRTEVLTIWRMTYGDDEQEILLKVVSEKDCCKN